MLEAQKRFPRAEQAQTQAERALTDKSARLEAVQRDLASTALQLEQTKKQVAEIQLKVSRAEIPQPPPGDVRAVQTEDKTSAASEQQVKNPPPTSNTYQSWSRGCWSYIETLININPSAKQETAIADPQWAFSVKSRDILHGDLIFLPIDKARSKPEEGKFFIVPVYHTSQGCLYFSKIGEELVASPENKYDGKQTDAFGIMLYLILDKPIYKNRIRFMGLGMGVNVDRVLIIGKNLRFEVYLSDIQFDPPYWSKIDGEIAYVLPGHAVPKAVDQPQSAAPQ